MSPSVPDKIRSNIINHTVDVHRYEASLQRKIRAMIDGLTQDLIKQLAGAGLGTPRTDWQRARLNALLKDAQQSIGQTYTGIADLTASEFRGLVEVTSNGIVAACNTAFGADLMVPVKWTPEMLTKLVDGTLTEGAPSAEWWSRQGDDLTQAFADQMRQGVMRGENLTQLRDRILGQDLPGVNAVGKVDLRTIAKADRGIYKIARRNAEALVRTSVISTANAAHMAAYAANSDIMEGVQWCSTLDFSTCRSCAALDLMSWKWGESHPTPSLHWNCRCTLLSQTKTWQQLAQEAGGDTRLAAELDRMEPGDRASMGGPVSGSLKYEDWFKDQPVKRQEEILGKGRMKLYEAGKIGFADMISQSGNPLTLKQLAAL